DLDDDGHREIVIDSDLAGEIFNSNIRPYSVRGSEADGTPVAGFPRPTIVALPNGLTNTAAVADFDGDGQLELFWVSGKLLEDDGTHLARLYLWDLPAAVRRSPFDWPMYRHDAAHTGAQLGTTCAPGTCGLSLPFLDGFESSSTAAWAPGPP
ncbi:MAG TPA: VCBS repeat-containing protein, partial [Thermoanaerobaculia bacterium]|nr:VCBS repeat-containing protein [Thermoanaerobaculia bacterium]